MMVTRSRDDRINRNYLGSVTCLCLLALILTAGSSEAQQRGPDRDPIADSLIGLWIDSVGGMETYHGFQSASFTVTTIIYDTLTGRIKRSRPRYVWIRKGPHGEESRIERWEVAGFIEQGFNGLLTWATLNGRLLPDTARDSRQALYVARDVFYWFGLPYKLKDPGVYLRYHGMQMRPGAELRAKPTEPPTSPPIRYHAVRVSFGEGVGEHQDVFTYYFSPGRAFPVEVTYVEEGRTNLNRLLWGETQRFGAIGYPAVIERQWITRSGQRTKKLVISDVVVNPAVPQDLFEIP